LRCEDRRVSTSMVGRILADLQRRGVLHEPPRSAVLLRAHRKLRKRPRGHSQPKHWRIEQPGDLRDLIEIDTKEIRMRGGVILKHFSASDVISRWGVVELHRRGTSLATARFLDTLLDRLPFAAKLCKSMAGANSLQNSS
jgi:putative transposase